MSNQKTAKKIAPPKAPLKTVAVLKRPASHKGRQLVFMSVEYSRLRVIVRSPAGASLFSFVKHGGQEGAMKAGGTEVAKMKKHFKCT